MFYTFVDIIDSVGNLVQASMKFHEEVGFAEVVSKLETGTSAYQAIRVDIYPTTYLELLLRSGQLI
jgi:hypothetical protein